MSILPEPNNQFTGNSAALADTARNLARTLQTAPASESKRAAKLRYRLIEEVERIAQECDEPAEQSGDWLTTTDNQLSAIRQMAQVLTAQPALPPPNLHNLVQALCERIAPNALIHLSSSEKIGFLCKDLLAPRGLITPVYALKETKRNEELPRNFIHVTYPAGEQDNILDACSLAEQIIQCTSQPQLPLGYVDAHYIAANLLGPAFFFAIISLDRIGRIETLATSLHVDTQHLAVAYHALKENGWLEHPLLGPEILKWDQYCGKLPEARLVHAASVYTPADFDRDVPKLWERLRNLMPPNDLEMDSVESAQPADPISILNAGWSFYLLHIDELYTLLNAKTPEDRYEAKQVLNRLLTKGIELSQITRQWQAAK